MTKIDTYSLISQEGYLISSCLATGLTELRKADVHNKGSFYTSLFNFSIGLERLMKAVVIIDHMLENKMRAPTKKVLKAYGHNVFELYGTCASISDKRAVNVKPRAELDEVGQDMLRSLNDLPLTVDIIISTL